MITSKELVNLVLNYAPKANVDLLKKAYRFAIVAHSTQVRASGAPYFSHPAEVARLLADLRLDVSTVITGLLHDILEDTSTSFEELEGVFGSEIASLVNGVTKLSKVEYVSSRDHQAENFRKFLLAMSKDIRVLIVKLIDRLHNMRTLHYITSIEKRKKIAQESLEIYAPLAERIGMNEVKDEIEDIAFYQLQPNGYSKILAKLEEIRGKGQEKLFIKNIIEELMRVLKNSGLEATIVGREKKVYSIWKKMQRRNVNVENINDTIAFRVIVKTVEQCYLALGILHTNYRIVPGCFKDYISIEKINGYRSLHTTVIGPLRQKIEIQIRTEEMNRFADRGEAAHWSYKKGNVIADNKESKEYNWARRIVSILRNSDSPEEVMNNSKLEMYDSEVFCFTPAGESKILPHGATAVDFAYEIHTSIGNKCTGAIINGRVVPEKTVIRNGDQVEIITSPDHFPDASWERFVVTGKAKSCIKKFIKAQEKTEFSKFGLQLVENIFSARNVVFSEDSIKYKNFSCSTKEEFFYNVGKGVIPLNDIRMMLSENGYKALSEETICLSDFTQGITYHISECCNPIPGDKIIGTFVPQKGLIIHLTNCHNMLKEKNAFIRVKWIKDSHVAFVARLRIVILNKTESFAIITNIISSNGASITNIKVEHRSVDFFDLLVDMIVNDIYHLGEIQAALRACSNVRSLRRL